MNKAQAAQVNSVGAACACNGVCVEMQRARLAAQKNIRKDSKNELPYPCLEFLLISMPLNFAMSDPLLIKVHVPMRVCESRTLIIDTRNSNMNVPMRVGKFGRITRVFS